VSKLISVTFVLSSNIWVVCSQLLSVEGILCEISITVISLMWCLKLQFACFH